MQNFNNYDQISNYSIQLLTIKSDITNSDIASHEQRNNTYECANTLWKWVKK